MSIKLIKKILIKGEIKVLTGLMIGSSGSAFAIGSIDKFVIRNPVTGQPYIPGSSIKGKMRSLLELSYGLVQDKGAKINARSIRYTVSEEGATAYLFGNAKGSENQRPSRLIVRDSELTQEGVKLLSNIKTDAPYTEVKTEVSIDRLTSVASPRTFERVPAGAVFTLDLVLNVFELSVEQGEKRDNLEAIHGTEKQMLKDLFTAMLLLQQDYLGGSGSRGYGQISFRIAEIKESVPSETEGLISKPMDMAALNVPNDLKNF